MVFDECLLYAINLPLQPLHPGMIERLMASSELKPPFAAFLFNSFPAATLKLGTSGEPPRARCVTGGIALAKQCTQRLGGSAQSGGPLSV